MAGLLLLDKESYVFTNEIMKTKIPRIFFVVVDNATAAISAETLLQF